MIKAVIFDMDGVLIDTEKYYIQLGMDITKEMGYEIPREVFLSMRSLNRKFSKPMLLEKYGEDFDFEYFHAERRKRLREILEYRGIEKKPGVDEVLAVLKKRRVTDGSCNGNGYGTCKFLFIADWRFRKI